MLVVIPLHLINISISCLEFLYVRCSHCYDQCGACSGLPQYYKIHSIRTSVYYRAVTQWFVVYSLLMFSVHYIVLSGNNYFALISILLLLQKHFTVSFRCQTTNGTTGEPVSSHKVVVSQRIIPIDGAAQFDLNLDVLIKGFSLCQCDYLPGADTNIMCSTVVRRCPISQNFTNVIFNT